MPDYTPGPWHVTNYMLDRDGETVGQVRICGPDKVTILDGCGCCDSPWLNNRADLPLIASAPDLLKALQALLLEGPTDEVLLMCSDTIAKALGVPDDRT